jgi:hypothetical protein
MQTYLTVLMMGVAWWSEVVRGVVQVLILSGLSIEDFIMKRKSFLSSRG